ncbi:MAG: HAD family phosphatase [Chloroflexota bacterium]|nr:HAD family phosphatase [Chloroflexota bacterium]
MSIPFDLVILDCDGVLVDSEPISMRVDTEVLAELGWRLTNDEVVERFMGRTHEFMVAQIEAQLGRPLDADWEAGFQQRYRDAFALHLKPVDGVLEVLDSLDASDTLTCVASSGGHEKMRFTLGLTGLWDRFEGRIFSATEVAHGKPAPDLFLHAAERMGVEPTACAVVEDSRYGVEAARAAGMRVFAYGGGLTHPDRLAGPDTVVFDDMRQLPRLLSGG